MKSFVRKIEEDDRWLAAVIGVLAVALVLAGEATNGLAYLPVYAVFAIQCGKDGLRQIAKKRSKALLGGDRSTGSR
jgi:hypothetical protein